MFERRRGRTLQKKRSAGTPVMPAGGRAKPGQRRSSGLRAFRRSFVSSAQNGLDIAKPFKCLRLPNRREGRG